MPSRRAMFRLLAAAALLAAVPAPVHAASLDDYRAGGVIAERFDGLVELRDSSAPAEARRLVQEVNAKRRDLYARRARQQGVGAEAVGQVYAQQILQSAPKGTYFRTQGGDYMRK